VSWDLNIPNFGSAVDGSHDDNMSQVTTEQPHDRVTLADIVKRSPLEDEAVRV
jgi:hypothetical protein